MREKRSDYSPTQPGTEVHRRKRALSGERAGFPARAGGELVGGDSDDGARAGGGVADGGEQVL